MKFNIALFTVFMFLGIKISVTQYTYPIYGGVMRSVEYADSNSSNIISIFSVSSQKIRLTNYSDYDTSISITANKVLDAFIPKKYFRNLLNNIPCDTVSIGHKKAVTRAQHVAFARWLICQMATPR